MNLYKRDYLLWMSKKTVKRKKIKFIFSLHGYEIFFYENIKSGILVCYKELFMKLEYKFYCAIKRNA
jgi:hypothetical protein